jgi:hypothetical protein
MQTYSNYKPSAFDTAGLGLSDRQDWLVAYGRNRDSDLLTQSNWDAFCKAMAEADAEGDDYETHTFNHWACRWVEILLVRPDSLCAEVAEEMQRQMDNYPVLNEEDFSEREWDAYQSYWDGGEAQDELARCVGAKWDCPNLCELIRQGDPSTVQQWVEKRIPSGDYWGEECFPRVRMVAEKVTSSELVTLAKNLRRAG